MPYEKVGREDLSDSVARQLRSSILDGTLQPGELLPPERELAEQFGVDRHTLRSALTELEQLRLVHRRQGSGCRVLDFRETGTLDLLKYLVVKPGTDEFDPAMVGGVMEVGRVTFKGLMDLVVDRADADDLTTMRSALLQLTGALDDGDAATVDRLERRFFREIFRGAHSITAELLVNTYDQIFDAALDPAGRVRTRWDDQLISSGRLEVYRNVIESIEQRDHAAARELVDVVLGGVPGLVAEVAAAPKVTPHRRRRRAGAG